MEWEYKSDEEREFLRKAYEAAMPDFSNTTIPGIVMVYGTSGDCNMGSNYFNKLWEEQK